MKEREREKGHLICICVRVSFFIQRGHILDKLKPFLAVFSVVLQNIFGGKLPEEYFDRVELVKNRPHGSS